MKKLHKLMCRFFGHEFYRTKEHFRSEPVFLCRCGETWVPGEAVTKYDRFAPYNLSVLK